MSDTEDGQRGKIEPALTPEEWGGLRVEYDTHAYSIQGGRVWTHDDDRPTILPDRHALAALCLYGQPYGFTREDVGLARAMATDLEESARVNDRPTGSSAKYAVAMHDLADRIEALLPPEEP